MVGRDDVGFAALKCARDAKETDDIAVIGVEELPGCGAVNADLVDLGRVGTGVLIGNVSDKMIPSPKRSNLL